MSASCAASRRVPPEAVAADPRALPRGEVRYCPVDRAAATVRQGDAP